MVFRIYGVQEDVIILLYETFKCVEIVLKKKNRNKETNKCVIIALTK